MKDQTAGFRIPDPPDRPLCREYAAGGVGDRRPLMERLTDRLLVERTARSARKLRARIESPETWLALVSVVEDAFRAGRAWQLDHPDRTNLEDAP